MMFSPENLFSKEFIDSLERSARDQRWDKVALELRDGGWKLNNLSKAATDLQSTQSQNASIEISYADIADLSHALYMYKSNVLNLQSIVKPLADYQIRLSHYGIPLLRNEKKEEHERVYSTFCSIIDNMRRNRETILHVLKKIESVIKYKVELERRELEQIKQLQNER